MEEGLKGFYDFLRRRGIHGRRLKGKGGSPKEKDGV